jgi:hypothetical protein
VVLLRRYLFFLQFSPYLLGHQGPQLVQVDAGLAQVGVVGVHVEVPHADLAEVAGVVLVKVDPEEVKEDDKEAQLPVVVLPTGVTATAGVLPVLPDPGEGQREHCDHDHGRLQGCDHEARPAVTVGDMTSQLPCLLLAGGHL